MSWQSNQTQDDPVVRDFLYDFRSQSGSSIPEFRYGWGELTPLSPFLFRLPPGKDGQMFVETLSDLKNRMFHHKGQWQLHGDETGENDVAKGVAIAFQALSETLYRRVSIDDWQCNICKLTSDKATIQEHVLVAHSADIKEQLKPYAEYLADDTNFMEGMFTKMLLDHLIKLPSRPFTKRGYGGLVVAPKIDVVRDPEEESVCEEMPGNGGEAKHVLEFKAKNLAPVNAFYNQCVQKQMNSLSDEAIIDSDGAEKKASAMAFVAEVLMKPIYEEFRKSKEAPKSESKENSQSLLDAFPEEPEKPRDKPVKRAQAPRFVPFIETIPEVYRDLVVHLMARSITDDWAKSYLPSIVRGVVTNRKKEYQKRLREEKKMRVRNEGRKRITEMRERRTARVNDFAEKITQQLLRTYMANEIAQIFVEEVERIREEEAQELPPGDSTEVVPPIIAQGLIGHRRYLSRQYVVESFPGFRWALEENGEPKIRFRLNGNRIEVLLYLATKEDRRRVLLQGQTVVDYSTVKFSETDDSIDDAFELYTGQEIYIMKSAKNGVTIAVTQGRSGYDDMCPVMDIFELYDKS